MTRQARAIVAADSRLQRWLLTEALNRRGCEVVGQDSIGLHAVQLADALRPDFVLIGTANIAGQGWFVDAIAAGEWSPAVLAVADDCPARITDAIAAALPSGAHQVRNR